MDLRQLLFFSTIAETSNLRRAAERLHISQPPLTVAIRKLEEELGVQLFERGAKGVRLTPAGKAALPAARSALVSADKVRLWSREGDRGERGALRIGFVGSSIFDLLPRLIPSFRARYPLVELSLEEATTHEMVPRLLAGTLDAALVRAPLLEHAAVDLAIIDHDELIAALPVSNPLADAERIDLSALAGETFVSLGRTSILRMTALKACHDAGFTPHIAQEVPQLSTVLCLVQSGLGVALVPSRVRTNIPAGVKLVHLDVAPSIETAVALSNLAAAPAAINFRSLAIELSADD
ncbi:LysR family transcriptional regulator [Sphingomonas oryzagri]